MQHLCTGPELVEIVRPTLHHPDPLIPVLAARVGAADVIGLGMAKLALDCVGIPAALFVQQCAGHGAEAVRGHRGAIEPHPAERKVDRVFTHRPVALALGGEQVAAIAADLAQFLQDGEHLAAERHAVRDAHLRQR